MEKLKSIDVIAQEVLDQKWGRGFQRITMLKEAGYDPNEVQKRVNDMIIEAEKEYNRPINRFKRWIKNLIK